MLNPIEKFKRSILHLNRSHHHWSVMQNFPKCSHSYTVTTVVRYWYNLFSDRFLANNCPWIKLSQIISNGWGDLIKKHIFFSKMISLQFHSITFQFRQCQWKWRQKSAAWFWWVVWWDNDPVWNEGCIWRGFRPYLWWADMGGWKYSTTRVPELAKWRTTNSWARHVLWIIERYFKVCGQLVNWHV